MSRSCHPAKRCCRTDCAVCAWKYTLGVSNRILGYAPRRLYAVTTQAGLTEAADFPRWRISVRNMVDYRRSQVRRWHEVGLWLWLSRNGQVHGICSPGSIGLGELVAAFGRRWSTVVRPIAVTNLREEVWHAMKPSIVCNIGTAGARYQHMRLAITPSSTRLEPRPTTTIEVRPAWEEPLPIVL